jgi:hypothetical protein
MLGEGQGITQHTPTETKENSKTQISEISFTVHMNLPHKHITNNYKTALIRTVANLYM